MHRIAIVVYVFGWLPVPGAAQDAPPIEFRHAMLVEGERSLDQRVRFPATRDDIDIDVVCRGHATAKGRLQNILCSAANDPEQDFINAVSRRVGSARVVPALVDGVPQDVDFQFTVNFRREGEEETIRVYHNNGHNTDRLGDDYIGAQRYSPHVWPGACTHWRDTEVVIEAATVDATGSPREVNAMSTRTRMFEACRAALMRQLQAGRWIPAMKDGAFVDSVWMSPIMLNMREVEF